jgi:hypothetical protein
VNTTAATVRASTSTAAILVVVGAAFTRIDASIPTTKTPIASCPTPLPARSADFPAIPYTIFSLSTPKCCASLASTTNEA